MKKLALVRHGETIWHHENRYAGRSDIELTAKGLGQARQLAMWAADAKLDSVWTSPLQRAKQTAEAAARAANLPLQIDDRLVELDFGAGEGLTSAEMQEKSPKQRAAFELDPVAHFLPGGESPEIAADRGMHALIAIAGLLPEGGRALVVAHSTLLRLLLCRSLGISLSRYRVVFPDMRNAAITELAFAHDRASLVSYNVPILASRNEPN